MNESIADLSASELTDLYRARALSPVEVTHAILDRIERLTLCSMRSRSSPPSWR